MGRGSSKIYGDRRCLIRVIEKQGDAIGRLKQKVNNDSKGINITPTTMGSMGQDFKNLEKETKYYASKLHQVYKRVGVSNIYDL